MGIVQKIPIILASNSTIRKKILQDLGLKFKVVKPIFDEEGAKDQIKNLSIKDQALYLAKHKALSISSQYPDHLIIASDQICQIGRKIFSKSNNKKEAINQLQKMQGKIHYQNNAVCLYQGKKLLVSHFEQAKLKMRKLTIKDIESYIDLDQSFGCAGSYKFESLGKHLFVEVEGNQDCILGMAIQKIVNYLHQKKLITFSN